MLIKNYILKPLQITIKLLCVPFKIGGEEKKEELTL